MVEKRFGWLNEKISYETNNVIISPLDGIDEAVREVMEYEESSDDWTYTPYEQSSSTGKAYKKPSVIFELPCTHSIQAKKLSDDGFIEYMVIMFGYCK